MGATTEVINEVNKGVKRMKAELRGIIDYLAEFNTLKKTPRQGWRIAGPPVEQDMVAAHVAAVAQIAFILARMEGVNALKCLALAVFHDNPETRIGERDKISTHYLETSEAFLEAMQDQAGLLPEEIGKEIFELAKEANYGKSPEAELVRDADILEASLQAKIFHEGGTTIPKGLRDKYLDEERVSTPSAKALMLALQQAKDLATHWWLEKLRM